MIAISHCIYAFYFANQRIKKARLPKLSFTAWVHTYGGSMVWADIINNGK